MAHVNCLCVIFLPILIGPISVLEDVLHMQAGFMFEFTGVGGGREGFIAHVCASHSSQHRSLDNSMQPKGSLFLVDLTSKFASKTPS